MGETSLFPRARFHQVINRPCPSSLSPFFFLLYMTPVAHRYKSNEEYIYVRGRGRGKYVCEECGIRCKKPSMLKKHIRTHTDVRPYVCKHCHFAFKTKGKRQSAGAPPCPWQGSPLGEPQNRALCLGAWSTPHILNSHTTWYPRQSSGSYWSAMPTAATVKTWALHTSSFPHSAASSPHLVVFCRAHHPSFACLPQI